MTILNLSRLLAWAFVTGFLADVSRVCVVVEAWSVLPVALGALYWTAGKTRKAWRTARADSIKHSPIAPPPDFPAQAKRPIR